MAERDIKENGTILQDIDLIVLDNNDGCHLDSVMRTFINYYVQTNGLLGVLGPPCSETVEPVASKAFTFCVFSCLVSKMPLNRCPFSSRCNVAFFLNHISSSRPLMNCVEILSLFTEIDLSRQVRRSLQRMRMKRN